MSEILPASPDDQPPPLDPPPPYSPQAPEQNFAQLIDIGTRVEEEYASSYEVANGLPPYFHIGLAPLFGPLTVTSVRMMDLSLLVAMKATLSMLANRDLKNMTWEEAVGLLRQNPALEDANNPASRQSTLLRRSQVRLRTQSDLEVHKDVKLWFEGLIQDQEVLRDTRIKPEVLTRIIARSDITIDSLRSLLHKSERKSETLLDIGIIRFPDIHHPHFRVYRIQLRAWAKREVSMGFVHFDSSGIDGVYNSCDFRPCRAILDLVNPQVQEQAVKEVTELLSASGAYCSVNS